jgi:RsiW-degrading membrane proteinase PrsW (M82 family)
MMAISVFRRSWLRTFMYGLGLYAVLTLATAATENVHLVPSVLMLGALLVPVTFVVYVFERLPVGAELVPSLATCFVVGGLLGTAAAAVVEYETRVDLGALPLLSVGLIEESVKLAIPLVLFFRRRFLAPSEGLLFGVAAGMGFASFETMGYGLAELISSRGELGPTEIVLAIRGVLSPASHAAWTGLICAALWSARADRARRGSWASVPAAFGVAVLLHTLWDAADYGIVHAGVAVVSIVLLATQLRSARRRSRPAGEFTVPSTTREGPERVAPRATTKRLPAETIKGVLRVHPSPGSDGP